MKKLILLLAFVLCGACAFCQKADKVTKILNSEKVTFAQVSYFISVAIDSKMEKSSDEQCFLKLKEENLLKKQVQATDFITLSDLAWLCVNTWDVSGSLMLKMAPGPRYGFKQLKADGIISANADPSKIPDGHEVLNVITECIEKYYKAPGVKNEN